MLVSLPSLIFANNDAAENIRTIDFLSKNLFTGDVIAANTNDPSHIYLGLIFGEIAGLTGSSMVMEMFRIFNVGVSLALVISVIYVGIAGFSSLPSEGGMIGSGRASPFMIFRTIAGFALVAPTPTGYSLIQKFVMNVVLSGVVVANYGWNQVLDSFSENSGLPEVVVTGPDTSALLAKPKDIKIQSDSSVGGEFVYSLLQQTESGSVMDSFLWRLNEVAANALSLVENADMIGGTYLSAPKFFDASSTADFKNGIIKIEAEFNAAGQLFRETVLQIQLNSLDDTNTVEKRKELTKAIKFYLLKILNDTSARYQLELLKRGTVTSLGKVEKNEAKSLKDSAMRGFVAQAPIEEIKGPLDPVAWRNQAKGWGWLGAGVYYLQFESALKQDQKPKQVQEKFWLPTSITLTSYPWIKPGKRSISCNENPQAELPNVNCLKRAKIDNDTLPAWLKYYLVDGAGSSTSFPRSKTDSSRAKYILQKLNQSPAYIQSFPKVHLPHSKGFSVDAEIPLNNMKTMSGTVLDALLNPVDKSTNQSFQGEYNSPLKTAMYVGFKMMSAAKTYWSSTRDKIFDEIHATQGAAYGTTAAVLMVKSAFDVLVQINKDRATKLRVMQVDEIYGRNMLGKLPSALIDPIMDMVNIMTSIAKSILGIYLPLGNGLATVYFLAGAILGIYIPFIPSVIYIFSILAWLFAVIESMVASPLITIGIAHPEGQEVMGRGEQAVMLLVGVFLRPVLSLVGMLIAVSLSTIAVELYNDIYLNIMPLYLDMLYKDDLSHALFVIFFAAGFVILYVYALLVIIEQCYSLIYMVPDRILKWLGGQADMAGAGVGGALQQISSGLSQDAGAAGQASGSQSTSGVHQDTNINRK